MSEEKLLQNCRICGSIRIKPVYKKEGLFIFKCLDCKAVFLGNQLDEKTIRSLYGYYGHSAFSGQISLITKLHYDRLLDSFEKYRKNSTIIDVGCGAGHFMLSAAGKGWDIEGTEISDEAIKIASRKTDRVIKGDIASLDLEKGRYDIATLFEVMEHSVDPEGIIKKLSHIIRPGGIIYITTPNFNSVTRRMLGRKWGLFHKEHLFYFTPGTLKQLLKKYGFKIKSVKTENLSLREILRIFKKSGSLNEPDIYEKQESLRDLTEKNILFSIFKKSVNFILNIFKTGETIYVTAQKKAEVS